MSHHSIDPEMQRAFADAMKKTFGEFPDGRLNKTDEGAIPLAIGTENGAVTISFARNLNWIGFTPEQAVEIAQLLIQHARKIATKPLTVKL